MVLTQHPHDHRFLREGDSKAAVPRVARLAEAFMLQRLREPVKVADVCAASGVSRRSLFAAFQAHHAASPIAWLRQRRLEAARALLEKPSRDDLRVSDVALEFGFPMSANSQRSGGWTWASVAQAAASKMR